VQGIDEGALARFIELMDDDLQTSQALAVIFDIVSEANSAFDTGDVARGKELGRTVALLASAMGLRLDGAHEEIDPATMALAVQRDAARAAKDFSLADSLRDQLQAAGWVVEDTPEGTALHR
jgi:cysteinyl-tRNA synthetase